MKTSIQITALVTLIVTMFFSENAFAAVPRSHHPHGVVQSVDVSAHSLTVQRSAKAQPLILQWNEDTRFRDEKVPARPEVLNVGQTVCVRYRVRPGRLEASSVDVRRKRVPEKNSARGGASDLMRD